MPSYTVTFPGIDIPRKGAVLDTNVLFPRFMDRDSVHGQASDFLENTDYFPIVLSAVVIETWGMIVGSRKDWKAGGKSWTGWPIRGMSCWCRTTLPYWTRRGTARRWKMNIVDAAWHVLSHMCKQAVQLQSNDPDSHV